MRIKKRNLLECGNLSSFLFQLGVFCEAQQGTNQWILTSCHAFVYIPNKNLHTLSDLEIRVALYSCGGIPSSDPFGLPPKVRICLCTQ